MASGIPNLPRAMSQAYGQCEQPAGVEMHVPVSMSLHDPELPIGQLVLEQLPCAHATSHWQELLQTTSWHALLSPHVTLHGPVPQVTSSQASVTEHVMVHDRPARQSMLRHAFPRVQLIVQSKPSGQVTLRQAFGESHS